MSGRALRGWALAAWALWCAGAALAQGDDSARRFTHKDWELACDNTRTCRAAGYYAMDSDGAFINLVSLRITRAAGPDAPVSMTLKLDDDSPCHSTLARLKIGKTDLGRFSLRATEDGLAFTPEQARAVLPQLLKAGQPVVWRCGDDKQPVGALSVAGLSAVLLKMDEWQGRLNTPGALARRGGKSESSVLPPVPAPVVKVAAPVPTRPEDQALAARIFPKLDLRRYADECGMFDEKPKAEDFEVHRLTAHRVLLSAPCQMGAYNEAAQHWIADDTPPYAPRLIEAQGDFNDADTSISQTMKGRGIGDCLSFRTWHFDGQTFVLTAASGDDMCRGFAGGAWNLPTYVSSVVPAGSGDSKLLKP